MKKQKILKASVIVSTAALIAACGGGGGSGSSTAAPITLNLNAAYAAMIQNGNSVLYTLSGDCTGYSSQTNLPAYATKNYATPAIAVWAVDRLQFDSLSAASQASDICKKIFSSNDYKVQTDFYNPTSQTIVNAGGTSSYWEVYSDQSPLPTSVSAGSTGVLYTFKDYKGASSTSTPIESGSVTYSVAADTSNSLLVTITKSANHVASGQLSYTVSDTYRLNANNTLTSLSTSAKATPYSDIKQSAAFSGTATTSVTLNLNEINIATLNAGSTTQFAVYDSSDNQCSPNATNATGPISSTGGTTSKGVTYAKSNTSTFTPRAFTGSDRCTNFNLPLSETSYYDANYALVQKTSVNSPTEQSSNITSSSVPYPNSATIGSSGLLYTFNRVSESSSTPFATGNSTYLVGGLTPTQLAVFEINTKNYTDGSRVGRQIWVNTTNSNNLAAPFYGYVNDGGTFRFIPVN